MIFIDTCYIIALMNTKATKHNESIKLLPLIENESTLINSTVLLEVQNNLHKHRYRNVRDEILELIYNMDNIYYLTENDYIDSLELYKHYNYSVNYSDCTIIKTMEKYQITNILSFNGDFDKIKGINRIYL